MPDCFVIGLGRTSDPALSNVAYSWFLLEWVWHIRAHEGSWWSLRQLSTVKVKASGMKRKKQIGRVHPVTLRFVLGKQHLRTCVGWGTYEHCLGSEGRTNGYQSSNGTWVTFYPTAHNDPLHSVPFQPPSLFVYSPMFWSCMRTYWQTKTNRAFQFVIQHANTVGLRIPKISLLKILPKEFLKFSYRKGKRSLKLQNSHWNLNDKKKNKAKIKENSTVLLSS